MNYFTIKDVENLSGIKAHTWRIWEQRHQICLPQRKVSKHRFYDSENMKQILRISYLYHTGIKISNIAKLNEEQVLAMASKDCNETHEDNYYIKELLEASFDFDVEKFENICAKIFSAMPTEKAVLNIIYPFLERVGVLWLTDHMLLAQEHFTSNIIRNQIIAAINNLPKKTAADSDSIILFTPEKEQHEMPLLFIHYLLKKAGKKVHYFGSNIKLSVIKEFEKTYKITHLYFLLITNFTNQNAEQYLQDVAKKFPAQKIIMSGTQAAHIISKPTNCIVLTSIQAILDYTERENFGSI